MSQNKTAKEIANLIIAEIKSGDDYSWNFHSTNMSKKFEDMVGRFYYFCCQSKEAQSEDYKDPNRKRQICYDCKEKITIQVDLVLNATEVDIYHSSLHPRSDLCIEITSELQEEIETHSHLTASIANQKLFQRSNDHIESACKLLSEHECDGFQPCLEIRDSDTTGISFITPLLEEIKNHDISISEIYLDATYKTARGRYELYGIIADVEGTGFLIAYLVLDTTRAMDTSTSTGKCCKILECFLETIKAHDINPEFVFTDKDFAEINAATNVWGPLVVQLCTWHIKLDLLFWTLINEIIPVQKERLLQIVAGVVEPWWWEDFKKEWIATGAKGDQNTSINADEYIKDKRKRDNEKMTELENSYFTDISRSLNDGMESISENGKRYTGNRKKRYQRATWTSNRKPYLMYLSYPEESDNSEKTDPSERIQANNADIIDSENTGVRNETN
ncbi:ATP-dependent DNA helicase pif1 [Gigaspora margarita]|uniref:ATP-dependent DNA helicase pif1 n=1 Tax=Gigaspora margarita TaxID=4874 RepID=A0A8H4ATG2_GIGMA|nr:ATP-dependent DNA helicase pif1 [Gigaspora margarita]